MSPGRAVPIRWWATRVAFPAVALGLLAFALRGSHVDRASLEPFYDPVTGGFPLRHDWFFENVLHLGGRILVIACTVALLVGALFRGRSTRWREHAGTSAYLVVCTLLTVGLAGAWKHLAGQVAPWDTIGLGGTRPWSGSGDALTVWDVLGSPGTQAASGFAWMALYYVGASLGTRHRWLWIAPGLLLGLLFALGEHARGANQLSHWPWSIAIAWAVATGVALGFRHAGWLEWKEIEPRAVGDAHTIDAAAPWLVGVSVGFYGVAFFAVDMLTHQFEASHPGVHLAYEFVELTSTALGYGVVAWLLTDRFISMRAREASRVDEERERRFQVLGRLAAAVAHEVRNPLQSVRLIVDEQRHEVAGLRDHPLQPEFEASIERIDRAVDLVYRLARPESGEVEFADLAQIAREAIVALSRIDKNRVHYAWERDPPRAVVASSRTGLRIVLDNLLRNAAQATPVNGTVLLELEPHADCWQLRIRNQGSLNAPAPKTERGLGLGVPISRQLAMNAGGSIDIEDTDGVVTCTLRWPREVGGSA